MYEKRNNIGGVFIALFLGIFLVQIIMVTAGIHVVSSVVSSGGIQQVMEQIDFKELIQSSDAFRIFLGSDNLSGVGDDTMEDLLEGELFAELMELHLQDLMAGLEDPRAEEKLDLARLKELVEEHMDELVPVVREAAQTQTGEKISKKEAQELITESVEEHGRDLLRSLPSIANLDLPDFETTNMVMHIINVLMSDEMFWCLIAMIVLLEALIFLCHRNMVRGCNWLLSINLMCAESLFAMGLILKTVAEGAIPEPQNLVINPVIQVTVGAFYRVALVLAIAAAVCLIARVTLWALRRRKERMAEDGWMER